MVKTVIVHTENFTVCDNKFIQDNNLSAFATAILTYALSLPKDWKFSIDGFRKRFESGYHSVYKALKELESKKYLQRKQSVEKGRFGNTIYHFFEMPFDQLKEEKINITSQKFVKTKVDYSDSATANTLLNLPVDDIHYAEIPNAEIQHAEIQYAENRDTVNKKDDTVLQIPCHGNQTLINTNIINTNKKKKDVYKYTSKKEENTEPEVPSPQATELLAVFNKSYEENFPMVKGKRPTQGACYFDKLLKNYSFDDIKTVIKFTHSDHWHGPKAQTPKYLHAKIKELIVLALRPKPQKFSFDKPKIDRTQSWWDDYAPTCNPEQCATDEEKIALGLIPSHLKEKFKAQGGKI